MNCSGNRTVNLTSIEGPFYKLYCLHYNLLIVFILVVYACEMYLPILISKQSWEKKLNRLPQ